MSPSAGLVRVGAAAHAAIAAAVAAVVAEGVGFGEDSWLLRYISLAAILTAVVPFLADWNDSHLFSPQWSPHARFHGVVSVGMTTMLSSVALWLLWRRSPDQDAAVTAAAAIPIAYWGPFFLAPFVPGTAVEDPGHRLVRIVGVPSNLMGGGATVVTAGLGWYLDRRLRPAAAPAN